MREYRIAFVTAYPPSKTTLNEYGYHFARVLAVKPEVIDVVALVEDEEHDYVEQEGVTIQPTWKFNSPLNPLKILRALRRIKPDIVIYNIHFTSFGTGKVAAASGLMIPWMGKLMGFPAVTLIHNIMETTDLASAGYGAGGIMEKLIRGIGTVLTKFVLKSDVVAVTLPRYVEVLRTKYGADNVVLAPHGAFETNARPPQPDSVDGPQQVLTFGKFGTYKVVHNLIEAFQKIQPDRPDLELVVAGGNSPNAPGYVESMKEKYGENGIRYWGYVEEEDIPQMFLDATLVVFDYTGTTGSSGVLHQTGDYGRPAVMPNIGDLADLVTEEGYMARYFQPGDVDDLARVLDDSLGDLQWLRRAGTRNHHASTGMPIEEIADWYMLHIMMLARDEQVTPVAA